MGNVRTGISLIYWGIIVLILGILGAVAGAVMVSGQVIMAGVVAGVVGSILMLIGRIMCLGAPQETGGREYIMVSVFLDLISIAISVGRFVTPEKITPTIESAGQLFSLVASVLFILFLKQLSLYLRRDDLAEKASSLLTLGIAMIVTMILMIVLVFVAGPIAGLLGLVVLVLGIIVVVRYVGLIANLKTALDSSV